MFHLLILALVGTCIASPASPWANATDESLKKSEFLKHLASKGPYPLTGETAEPVEPPKGCEIVHAYVVARHGSRNPTDTDIDRFKELEALVSSHPTSFKKYPDLVNWTSPYSMSHDALLAPAGAVETWKLGRRMAKRYKKLMRDKSGTFGSYNPNHYKLRSTLASRAGQSLSAFTAGLFYDEREAGKGRHPGCGMEVPVAIKTMPTIWDYELSSKHSCPKWADIVDAKQQASTQSSRWASTHGTSIAIQISKHLQNLPLTATHANTIFKACAFDLSLTDTFSGWCHIINDAGRDAVHLLEYLDDLVHWWMFGYGDEFNGKMGCALVTDVVREARRAGVGSGTARKMVVGYGHSDTLTFFASTLGLFKGDVALTGDLDVKGVRGRKWRLSALSPMAGNIVVEVFKCGDGVRVRLMVNEEVVLIPGCGVLGREMEGCGLEEFERGLGERLGCDFEFICNVPGGGRGSGDSDDEGGGLVRSLKKDGRFVVQA